MTSQITEVDQFDATLDRPNNGETADASTLLTLLWQKLSNRTRFLYNEVRSRGVRRIRCGTLAEMQALTGAQTDDVFWVRHQGLYIKTTSGAAGAPFGYAAADSGNWYHCLYGIMGYAMGIPQLDSQQRVPATYLERTQTVSDADLTIEPTATALYCPTLTADRTWTLPADAEYMHPLEISTVGADTSTHKLTIRRMQNGTPVTMCLLANSDSYTDTWRSVKLRNFGAVTPTWRIMSLTK
jgi:hypothetical protein